MDRFAYPLQSTRIADDNDSVSSDKNELVGLGSLWSICVFLFLCQPLTWTKCKYKSPRNIFQSNTIKHLIPKSYGYISRLLQSVVH